MEGWIIDYQTDSGPDYTFRNIMVIVDEDEDSAKRIFLDNYDYEGGDKYLSLGFEEMVGTIIEDDPEEYTTGAGWEMIVNSYNHYDNVSSNEASYEQFYFATEDPSIKDVLEGMIDVLPSINDYIKDKIGISSHYKIEDFISSINLDEDEFQFLQVPGISHSSILMTMLKRDIF